MFLYSCFQWCEFSRVPGCYLLQHMNYQKGSQILVQRLMSHHLIAYLPNFNIFLQLIDMVILSKVCKPNNFGTHKSWRLSFTYIRGLWSNFVDYESFLELNYFNILTSCDRTWKTQLNLAISLWGVIFLKFQRTLLHICMVLQVKWMSKLLLHRI